MAEKIIRLFIVVFAVFALSACARPVGDLGRAKPGVLHDEILPTAGKLRAKIFQEQVSWFNWTDEEVEMHDRVWRFLIAPHSNDWFFDVMVEWQRTRLVPQLDTNDTYNRYYLVLRSERYRSSNIRYARVTNDIKADIATMPGVFAAICAVEEIDRQRREAANSLVISEQELNNLNAREHENQVYISWFISSARYRYNSYSFALEHLLVETPHPEARLLDAKLSELAILVERAERRDFCSSERYWISEKPASGPKSRMERYPFTPDPKFRK